MIEIDYLDLLKLTALEAALVLGALGILFVDLGIMSARPRRERRLMAAAIACLCCLGALFWLVAVAPLGHSSNGMLVVDPLVRMLKCALLVMTAFTALLSIESDFTDHVGEYFALLLLATVGMMFLTSAEDFLMVFVSLELTSLPLYVLTAFNKRNVRSAEAALKYFLFGGMAAAFTLFGISLIYGLSGATGFRPVAAAIRGSGLDPVLVVALVMTIIGFAFKVAAAPFHLWAPDVYEGAPTPSAALIASGSKVAGFFVLARILKLAFEGAAGNGGWQSYHAGWVPILAILSVLSMLVGNLAAIAQRNVKRLLAYSAVAHVGYALIAMLVNTVPAFSALIYYIVTYALTALGAFGVISIVEQQAGDANLSSFSGLAHRSPFLSGCMMVFMLSLAGIPPLAGFFGKWYIFVTALGTDPAPFGLLWMVVFAIAMSAVSLYYYLLVLKQIFVADAVSAAGPFTISVPARVTLALLAIGVVAIGCLPEFFIAAVRAGIVQAAW